MLPLALTPCPPTSLISYALRQTQTTTTLLICIPRQTFLSTLLKDVSKPSSQHPQGHDRDSNETSSPAQALEPENSTNCLAQHPLLIPTLQQISSSKHVNLVFIPTVSHLRAYLSVYSSNPREGRKGPGVDHPLLVAYGALELHRETSEWSVQGLTNSLATLVEAGARTGNRVQLVEASSDDELGGDWHDGDRLEVDASHHEEEAEDEVGSGYRCQDPGRHALSRSNIWFEKLPILNGSLRRAGADLEYAGRTVDVGVVLKRWFKFQRGDWDG